MALPKVCGIETEYGIIVRGGESNPVSASSLLINAFMAKISDRRSPRTGWDFNDEQPGNDARGFNLDDVDRPRARDDARQRRAHQRCPLLRRPRPPGDLQPGDDDGARGGALGPRRRGDHPHQRRRGEQPARPDGAGVAAAARRDRRLQEQLRRQGQQLRLPRELPAGARDAVRAARRRRSRRTSSPARSSAAPARSAAKRPAPPTTRCRSSSASGPTSSKRRSGWRRR